MPRLFADSFFDDFFGTPQVRRTESEMRNTDMMKTDIRESASDYEVIMNLPGIRKENVKAELKDGYLTIQASSDASAESQNGKYIRRERFTGSCSRSFYVGEEVTQQDIHAKFENGTLVLTIPKKEKRPANDGKRYISIEG